MATTTATNLKDELIARERAYLDAVRNADGSAAAGLTAGETMLVSGRGAMRMKPDDIKRMMTEHDGQREYSFDESSVEVMPLTDDVAVISYALTTRSGETESRAFDTDVWVKRDGDWRCALHAEVPAES